MKTAYVINSTVYFYNKDGGSRYTLSDLAEYGSKHLPEENQGQLLKISFEGEPWRKINVCKVVKLDTEKELKSLEKRAKGNRQFRVGDPGVMGRMAVEARIRGLQESKRRYAQNIIWEIEKQILNIDWEDRSRSNLYN